MAYKEIVSPVLDRLDSEHAHVAARELLHLAEISPLTLKILELFADQHKRFTDPRLRVVLGGIELENPLLVGAGWDKNGRAVRGLWQLGAAGVEVGSVLAHPQPGNDKPRQWMVGRGVSLNRLGFNTPKRGLGEILENLEHYKDSKIPIGISIGKNKDIPNNQAPFVHGMVIAVLYKFASYFAINVSSPNTPNLRNLQDKKPLTDIVQFAIHAMESCGGEKPLFVKIAPDLTDSAIDDVIEVVVDNGLTGIIATNTTINSEIKNKYGVAKEAGGLAGDDPDFRALATQKIKHIYSQVGKQIDIIGVGGIKDSDTAFEKIRAGAKAIQIVTAIRGEGTAVFGKINRGLVEKMEELGIRSLEEIRGSDLT